MTEDVELAQIPKHHFPQNFYLFLMYDIIELNGKKVAELREIATKLEINRVDKLKKQDLVYAILDEQALRPQDDSPQKKLLQKQKIIL